MKFVKIEYIFLNLKYICFFFFAFQNLNKNILFFRMMHDSVFYIPN